VTDSAPHPPAAGQPGWHASCLPSLHEWGVSMVGGGLAEVHPVDLSALVLTEIVRRTGLDPADVHDVVWGCVSQIGDQSSNIGRFAVLAADWPESIPGTTINRACGSSQQALDYAAHAVMCGAMDIVVAGGVESMSRVPPGGRRARS
jgi:acetyl-CoA acyltransferase